MKKKSKSIESMDGLDLDLDPEPVPEIPGPAPKSMDLYNPGIHCLRSDEMPGIMCYNLPTDGDAILYALRRFNGLLLQVSSTPQYLGTISKKRITGLLHKTDFCVYNEARNLVASSGLFINSPKTQVFKQGNKDLSINSDLVLVGGSPDTRLFPFIGRSDKYWLYQNNGKWCIREPKGIILYKGEYLNGLQNGECTSYYPSGKIASEESWISGVPHGAWRFHSESGKIQIPLNYSHGYCMDYLTIPDYEKIYCEAEDRVNAELGISRWPSAVQVD